MNVAFWATTGNLVAEVETPAVPRAGDTIDIDGERFHVRSVKWVVIAEVMSAEVFVESTLHAAKPLPD